MSARPALLAAAAVLLALLAVPRSSAGTGSWATQTSGTTNALNGLRCASPSVCWAVGASGTIRATTNGGTSWSGQTSGSTASLTGVACPSTSVCWTVGATGIDAPRLEDGLRAYADCVSLSRVGQEKPGTEQFVGAALESEALRAAMNATTV